MAQVRIAYGHLGREITRNDPRHPNACWLPSNRSFNLHTPKTTIKRIFKCNPENSPRPAIRCSLRTPPFAGVALSWPCTPRGLPFTGYAFRERCPGRNLRFADFTYRGICA